MHTLLFFFFTCSKCVFCGIPQSLCVFIYMYATVSVQAYAKLVIGLGQMGIVGPISNFTISTFFTKGPPFASTRGSRPPTRPDGKCRPHFKLYNINIFTIGPISNFTISIFLLKGPLCLYQGGGPIQARWEM